MKILCQSLILFILCLSLTESFASICQKGFYNGIKETEAKSLCLDEHFGEEFSYNSGECICIPKGSRSANCIRGSYQEGLKIDQAISSCHAESGVLTFENGNCQCLKYTSNDQIKIDGHYYNIPDGHRKCRYDLERTFTKTNEGQFVCQKNACIIKLKEHISTVYSEESFDSGFIANPAALEAHRKAVAQMEQRVCDKVNSMLTTDRIDQLLSDKNIQCDKQQSQGAEIRLNLSIGEGKKKVICATQIEKSGGKFEVENLAKNFPNNIISVMVDSDHISHQNGNYAIVNAEVKQYRGSKTTLSLDEFNKMQEANRLIAQSFSAEIDQIIKNLDSYYQKVKRTKDLEVIFNEFGESSSIKISVSSFASLLNTGTKFSNYELAKARRSKTIQDLKVIISDLIFVKMSQLAKKYGKEINQEDYRFIANKIKVVIPEHLTEKDVFGTLGPIVPSTNTVGQQKVINNAKLLEGKFPACDSSMQGEELFKCTFEYFIMKECGVRVDQDSYQIFPECKAKNLISSGLRSFDQLYSASTGEIARAKNAFLSGDKNYFDKYKNLAVSGSINYLMQTSETIPVKSVSKRFEKDVACSLQLNNENLPGIQNYKSGAKAHISYDVDYLLKETVRYIKSGTIRYLKKPVGLIDWAEKTLTGECKKSLDKARGLYQQTFGRSGIIPHWLQHWENDHKNYKAAGGIAKFKDLMLDTFDKKVVTKNAGQYIIFDENYKGGVQLSPTSLGDIIAITNSPYITKSIKFKGIGHGGESGKELPRVSIAVNGEVIDSDYTIENSSDYKEIRKLTKHIETMHALTDFVGVEICYIENHDDRQKSGVTNPGKRRLLYQQEYVTRENEEKVQTLESEILDGLTLEENICDDQQRDKNREQACRFFYLDNRLF